MVILKTDFLNPESESDKLKAFFSAHRGHKIFHEAHRSHDGLGFSAVAPAPRTTGTVLVMLAMDGSIFNDHNR